MRPHGAAGGRYLEDRHTLGRLCIIENAARHQLRKCFAAFPPMPRCPSPHASVRCSPIGDSNAPAATGSRVCITRQPATNFFSLVSFEPLALLQAGPGLVCPSTYAAVDQVEKPSCRRPPSRQWLPNPFLPPACTSCLHKVSALVYWVRHPRSVPPC
jgi:hypothetical protein